MENIKKGTCIVQNKEGILFRGMPSSLPGCICLNSYLPYSDGRQPKYFLKLVAK